MAVIRLKNNECRIVSASQGATIWRILNGEIEGTESQQRFCSRVDKVYLNKHNAPLSYRQWLIKESSAGQARLPYAE